ncbi:uncharacterized protein LOC121864873 [Homarus americanus]|uniref:uncharacterized protein LOC121864873 n=1 Tax=Homarus americanus TaxID=6706 RepID=UPI001C4543C8|nr:uncharacterized protein LOC121864873 [Homarus americanus]
MKWLLVGVVLGVFCLVQGRNDDAAARVIAVQSVRTTVVLTTLTSSAPVTCAFATEDAVCQRRRFRRFQALNHLNQNDQALVEGSMADEDDLYSREERDADRQPRVAFTIWSTTSSTFTVTTTSFTTGTTFSLSFFCTVSGADFPNKCG